MKTFSKLRKIFLAIVVTLMLTACGGGGGGAPGAVYDFVQNDLSNLSNTSSIVSKWSSVLSSFHATNSSTNIVSLMSILTNPDAEDKATANALLIQLRNAESLWAKTDKLISSKSDSERFEIYNGDAYKEAYAAMIYLSNHAKPVIQQVANGQAITLEEMNSVVNLEKAQLVIETEKTGSAVTYAEAKKIKSSTARNSSIEFYNQIEDGTPIKDLSGVAATWTPIEGGGGRERRTIVVTTPQIRVVRIEMCSWIEVVKLTAYGTSTKKVNEKCSTKETKTDLPPNVENVAQEQEGSNPVVKTEILAELVSSPVTEWNSEYGSNGIFTKTTIVSTTVNTPDVVEGSETTNTLNYTKTRTTSTEVKNRVIVIVDNWIKTTVTKPIVTIPSNNVVYKDTKTKQKRTWTITTKRKKVTYRDSTSEIIETKQSKIYTNWELVQISEETRTVREEGTPVNGFDTPDITDTFISQASSTLRNNAYTDNDADLGTKTTGLSATANDFKTTEFNKDSSKSLINADKAYARGWTGQGVVLGVIDSFQQTDHEALDGKYKWYNNYVRYEDGTKDSNGNELGTVANGGKHISHGTHVAGIIAGSKNDGVFHGVAFDAELVGANIDYYGSGSAHVSYALNALQDMTKLKSTNAQGGEGMNVVAINMSFNKTNVNFHYGAVIQLNDGTYSAPKITNIMQGSGGGAQYWKVATNNNIVLVNSAGNGLYINGAMNYDYALDPGIWATEVDSGGNLVLGGKMIIVGNWGGTKEGGQVVGSKAGHVCLNIVNNACNDPYKTSDFYILAPGNTVWSSVPNDGYLAMGGSSMAAPQVTGAIGILHQMWPHMKSENLVKLVLNTADTNINGYNVNIHGQGILDLDEATQPQGAVGIPTTGRVDGAVTSLNNTYFATGSSSAFSTLSELKIMVIDNYDRDFYINLGDSFTLKDNRKYSDIDMLMANNNTFLPMQQKYGSFTQGGQYNLINNYSFGLYTGDNGGGDYSLNIVKKFLLHKSLKLKTNVGQVNEQDTWLGNSSSGLLAVGDNNTTNFGNIGIEYTQENNVLSLDYTRGKTDINTTKNSLIKGFSDIKTSSYRLAYEIHKDKQITFGWSLSFPSHITSGAMVLEIAKSVNLDGTINYTNIDSSLEQNAKEKNLGFYYSYNPENDMDAGFNFTAEYRQDIAGQEDKDGFNLSFNYIKKLNTSCGLWIWKNPKCHSNDTIKRNN